MPASRHEGPPYFAQVDLLLQILPLVAREPVFALKGGTVTILAMRHQREEDYH